MIQNNSPFAQFLSEKIITLGHFVCQPRQNWSFSAADAVLCYIVLYCVISFLFSKKILNSRAANSLSDRGMGNAPVPIQPPNAGNRPSYLPPLPWWDEEETAIDWEYEYA